MGGKFSLEVFGDGDPVIATEGWKDAFRIHLERGKTTVALSSVNACRIIPPSVQDIVYEADSAHNPFVWGLLIRVGIANKAARIGFFPREFAGDKGGACEFFNSGGDWWEVSFAKPCAVLRDIPKGRSPDLRADYIRGNLRVLIHCMDELGFDPIDTELLLEQVIDADGGETTPQPQGDGYRIAGIRVHTSTSVTENKIAWLICQRFTSCDMAR